MALPKQIEQQQRELEELEKQLKAQSEAPPAEETKPEAQDPPDEKPESPPDVQDDKEQRPPQPVTPDTSEDVWQQRYKTLEGKYSAEVPRLHAQVKDLMAQLNQLQETMKKPEPKEEPEIQKLVTDADVEAFGSDLIEVQRKVAREVAQEFKKDIDALRSENAKLREELLQTGSQVGAVSFETRLYQLVPDFAQVNADPKWVAWLDETDPIIRGPRRTVAQDAFNRGDAEAIRDYVQMFKALSAEPPEDNKRKAELERQVQPNRSASSAPPSSQKGRTYSTKDIEKMFEKAAKLNATQKFDEAQKLEAEIDAAYMEGRVTA
jgi:hypothetical protein